MSAFGSSPRARECGRVASPLPCPEVCRPQPMRVCGVKFGCALSGCERMRLLCEYRYCERDSECECASASACESVSVCVCVCVCASVSVRVGVSVRIGMRVKPRMRVYEYIFLTAHLCCGDVGSASCQ